MFGIRENSHPRKIGKEYKKFNYDKHNFIEYVNSYKTLYPFSGTIILKNVCKTLERPLAVW